MNELVLLAGPDTDQSLMINQDAWISMGKFDEESTHTYNLHNKENGVFAMVVSGRFEIEGNVLEHRDSIEITEIDKFDFKSLSDKAEILFIEVPMKF